jgi:hypothetical protein
MKRNETVYCGLCTVGRLAFSSSATGSIEITNLCPRLRSAADNVVSFVGCFGSRMRRASFSSFPSGEQIRSC